MVVGRGRSIRVKLRRCAALAGSRSAISNPFKGRLSTSFDSQIFRFQVCSERMAVVRLAE